MSRRLAYSPPALDGHVSKLIGLVIVKGRIAIFPIRFYVSLSKHVFLMAFVPHPGFYSSRLERGRRKEKSKRQSKVTIII